VKRQRFPRRSWTTTPVKKCCGPALNQNLPFSPENGNRIILEVSGYHQ